MVTPRVFGVLLLLALAACASRPTEAGRGGLLVPRGSGGEAAARPAVSDAARWEFWTAVASLDLRGAERRSPDGEHRRLVRAIRQVLDGRMQAAESPLVHLASTSEDSLLRSVSQIALTAALEYQGKWAELDDFSRESDRMLPQAGLERAAIEAWAGAMRLAPSPEYRFPREPVVLPFVPAVTSTPVVSVRVNGVSRWFWIDTGSSITLIASDVAAQAGVVPLTADTLEMVTAVGVTSARPALIQRLDVGGLSIANQPSAIIAARDLALEVQGEGGTLEVVRIDGVIGMDVIRRLNLEIDFFRSRVRIARPRPERVDDRDRNLLWLGYPLVRMEQADGRALYFGLDTGADRTYATEGLLRKLPKKWLRRQRQRISGFGGDTTLTVPTISTLEVRMGGRKFTLTELAVHAPRRLGFVQIDGVIGNDTAAGLNMRIDVTNGIFRIGLPFEGVRAPAGERHPRDHPARLPAVGEDSRAALS